MRPRVTGAVEEEGRRRRRWWWCRVAEGERRWWWGGWSCCCFCWGRRGGGGGCWDGILLVGGRGRSVWVGDGWGVVPGWGGWWHAVAGFLAAPGEGKSSRPGAGAGEAAERPGSEVPRTAGSVEIHARYRMLLGWVVLLGGNEGKKRWEEVVGGGWLGLATTEVAYVRRHPGHVWRDTCQTDCVAPFFFFLSGGLWCRGDTADGVSSGSWMGVESIVGFNEPYRLRFAQVAHDSQCLGTIPSPNDLKTNKNKCLPPADDPYSIFFLTAWGFLTAWLLPPPMYPTSI